MENFSQAEFSPNQMEKTVRYAVEHNAIPELLHSDERKLFMALLLKERGKIMVDLYKSIGNSENYNCPYSADDFVFKPFPLRDNNGAPWIVITEVEMPEPERPLDCRRVFFCNDCECEKVAYYTVEKGFNSPDMLCAWSTWEYSDFVHCNYGPAPEAKTDQLKKVFELYVEILREKDQNK